MSNPLTSISTFIQLLVMHTTQKSSISYSQALCFNRICSENQFFDKRCNDLEVWLKNVVKMRNWWDNKSWRLGNIGEQNFCIVREEVHKNKLVFNITYYPIFSKLKNILFIISIIIIIIIIIIVFILLKRNRFAES